MPSWLQMPEDRRKSRAKVSFIPEGTIVSAVIGETIFDACKLAGIPIDAVCGGEGKCGRCKVKPRGKFTATSSELLSKDEIMSGTVLACLARIDGDLTVEVLPRARLGKHQILTKSIEEVPKPLGPWARKRFVKLPRATIPDSTADLERLLRALKTKGLTIPLETLRELPQAVRSGDWSLTATISKIGQTEEVTRVEPRDTTERLLGIAVDIGTTTVVVDLVDLLNGKVLGTTSDYNKQISRGEDVIARMIHSEEKGPAELRALVLDTINSGIARLLEGEAKRAGKATTQNDLVAASVAGNTVMAHFLVGLDTRPIRFEPYVPVAHHLPICSGKDVELAMNPAGRVFLFPSRAGYVGGDVVADVLASGMHRSNELTLLIDVGTNGEVVLGGKEWLTTCACSAGPAFEGGEVSCGMRAMDGAIDRIRINDDLSTSYHVIGEGAPVGICGSGLIDLIAEMYCKGLIDRKARLQDLGRDRVRKSDAGMEYVVEKRDKLGRGTVADMVVTDADLQNLLRTKAAIYGACSVLLRKTGQTMGKLSGIVVAGGFGYHLDIQRAITIGMFPDVPDEKYRFIGNGALGGARLALLSGKRRREAEEIFEKMTYLELSVDNEFYDEFSSSLFIPHTDLSRFPSAADAMEKKERCE